MQLPQAMPGRIAGWNLDRRYIGPPVAGTGLTPQQGILDPRNIACAAACAGKAGFGACLARCLITGQACDGGVSNCTGV